MYKTMPIVLMIMLFFVTGQSSATPIKKCFVSRELSKKSIVSFTIDGLTATGTWTNQYETDGTSQRQETFPFSAEVTYPQGTISLHVIFASSAYHMPILWRIASHRSQEQLSMAIYAKDNETRKFSKISVSLSPCTKAED